MTIDVAFVDHPAYDCRYDAWMRKTNITGTEMWDTQDTFLRLHFSVFKKFIYVQT